MDPSLALNVIETSLRLAICDVLPGWQENPYAPNVEGLKRKQREEHARRDGTVGAEDLLAFTNTYDLGKIVLGNWELFKPIFDDKKRTESHLDTLEDLRNTIAHSRDLRPFEQDLLSGIAGMFRNQVTLFRSGTNQSSKHYPLIEKVTDSFGNGPADSSSFGVPDKNVRLEVGQTVTFDASANTASGKAVLWKVVPGRATTLNHVSAPVLAEGEDVRLQFTVEEEHVSEYLTIGVFVTTDSQYHRQDFNGPYDDSRIFSYAVNPPHA